MTNTIRPTNSKVIVNNRSLKHGSEGKVIDMRKMYGANEYLVLFDDNISHWFDEVELESIPEN
jgi:hypothetical protein